MADAGSRLRCALVLSLALLAAAVPCAGATPAASGAAASAKALDKYRALMADLPKPSNMVFNYAEMRTGPTRIVTSAHRVYRDQAGNQRNDTIAINDFPVSPPQTQTFQRATWPYFADQFDVPAADYDVKFAGVAYVGGRKTYVYKTKGPASATFAITELALDPATGIPLRELYRVSSADCDGIGEIDFMEVGQYLLPASVSAECTMSGGEQYKHVIRFSNFSFPAAIPQDVLHPNGTPSA